MLLLFLLLAGFFLNLPPCVSGLVHLHPRPLLLSARHINEKTSIQMSLSRATLHFDFKNIAYAAGVHHIHSPESMMLLNIHSTEEPKITENRTSIAFTCSSLLSGKMQARMYSTQPNESNLILFKDLRAMCSIRMTVTPLRAFLSHRMKVDVMIYQASHF
jgi:hypothetical protein